MATYDDDGSVCGLCGRLVSVNDPSHFPISESTVLCYECARRNGGAFDPETERWTIPPTLPAGFEAGRDPH